MRFKVLALIAAGALLAACESAPEATDSGATGGDQKPVVQAQQPSKPVAAPAGPAAGSEQDFVVNVGDRVFYGFDKYDLQADAQETLKRQAAWLKKYPSAKIVVSGHCDERGTREYNLALGERRANSVKDYLVALGVSAGRINSISYGKEKPVAMGHNEAAWAQNRRGVTVLVEGVPGS